MSNPKKSEMPVAAATPCSGFFIVNDFDCPNEQHIAQRRDDGKFYYVHPSLRRKKEYWGMTPDRPTPLEDFGITVELVSGQLRGTQEFDSRATYRDGRPRRWQGVRRFSFSFQNV